MDVVERYSGTRDDQRDLAGRGLDRLDRTGQILVDRDRLAVGTCRVDANLIGARRDAAGADGKAVAVDQYLTGTVEALEPAAGKISLVVAGASVPLGDVRTILQPSPPAG